MAYSLSLASTHCDLSEPSCQILILWRLALNNIKVELVLIASSAYTSLICMAISLFESIHWIFNWVSELIEISATADIHRIRLWVDSLIFVRMLIDLHLIVVASCLGSSLYLVLDFSSLFFVRVSNRDTLADLLVVGPIERMHWLIVQIAFLFAGSVTRNSTCGCLAVVVDVDHRWIVHSLLSSISLGRSRSITCLCRNSPLTWWQLICRRSLNTSILLISLVLLL